MGDTELEIKERVVQELEELPLEKLGEVLDFVVFLKARASQQGTSIPGRSLPASHLDGVVGLVAWGGDALAESERLYDG